MLLRYHLRLAVRSLRRDPGLSATIVVVLAVAAGIFCVAIMTYLRAYQEDGTLAPTLHHVEIAVPHDMLDAAFTGTNAAPNVIASRERTSFPMLRLLAGSGLAARQTSSFRTRLLVSDDAGLLPLKPRNARFANADLFGMFGLRFRDGAAWTRQDEARGEAVVVLGRELAKRIFGGANGVGRTVTIDDRPFRVVGVLADDQPFAPSWDRSVTGGAQDQLYLPFPEHQRLLAQPETPIAFAPEGPTYADLLRSDTVVGTFWIDLPTPELREAYARYLTSTLGARGVRYTLRDLAHVRVELPFPKTVFGFFVLVTFLVLAGAGLVATRLLLAKSLLRQGELSIFRAVGAPRAALMVRQLLEAALLAALGAVGGLAIAEGAASLYNHLIADTDIDLVITPQAFGIMLAATVLVGTVAAIYPAWRAAARRPTTSLMRA